MDEEAIPSDCTKTGNQRPSPRVLLAHSTPVHQIYPIRVACRVYLRFARENAYTDRVNPLSVIIVNLLLSKVNRFADKQRKNTPDLRIIRKSGAEIC